MGHEGEGDGEVYPEVVFRRCVRRSGPGKTGKEGRDCRSRGRSGRGRNHTDDTERGCDGSPPYEDRGLGGMSTGGDGLSGKERQKGTDCE